MSVKRKLCGLPWCSNWIPMENTYCSHHDATWDEHNEDEIIVPSEDDVDEELLTSAFTLSAADLLRMAKKQGFITPTSEYAGVPAA